MADHEATSEHDASEDHEVQRAGKGKTKAEPTILQAFVDLAHAMEHEYVQREDLPAAARCQTIRIWADDGNHVVAWQHAVQLLEGIIGQPLTLS